MRRSRRTRRSHRGQSLVEFALILPVLLMLVGGIVQYGMIFATKHSLVQIGRDVGRWAATQTYAPCSAATADAQPVTEANAIALQSRLIGYSDGEWNTGNMVSYGVGGSLPAAPAADEGVEVAWSVDTGNCPPRDGVTPPDVAWVTVRLTHRAPVVLPGFPYLPGIGDFFVVSTTATYRMEPAPPS